MYSLLADLRFAFRSLRRNPGFAAVAILALALGIGANSAVFTVVNGVLLRPLPFAQADRLFLVSDAPRGGPFGRPSGLVEKDYLTYRDANRSFEVITTFGSMSMTLTGAGDPARLAGASVTTSFLDVMGARPAIGTGFRADQANENVILLSDSLWRRRFESDRGIVGREVTLDGMRHTVAGVMPEGFNYPYAAEFWKPMEVRFDPHRIFFRPVIGRLKPGVSQEQAFGELQAMAAGFAEQKARIPKVLPLKETIVGNVRASITIFAEAVGFVLLIACVNVANLLLMRTASRRHEIAVRAAIGAGARRLMRQFLTESTVIALAGGVAGILFALWGVPALLALAPAGRIPRTDQVHIDAAVLWFTVAVSVVTGIVFGMAPAWQATRIGIQESLGGKIGAPPATRLRHALAVAEIALALVLLTGAGLMLKSFLRLRSVDKGFQTDHVMAMTVDLPHAVYREAADMRRFDARLLEHLRATPGVVAAGLVNWRPLGGMLMRGSFYIEGGKPTPPDFLIDKMVISSGYFQTMGIRLLKGRDFTERDTAESEKVTAISRSVAQMFWPGEDPIGKRVTGEDNPKPEDWMTIVAVVDDVKQETLSGKSATTMYQLYTQVKPAGWLDHATFAIRTSTDATAAGAAMRRALHEVDPNQPAQSMATLEELVAKTIAEPEFQTRLLLVFAVLAVLLAAIGVYGVLANLVTLRTQEIGIRMALGADQRDVMRMVMGRTAKLTAAGIVIGTAGALAATRVLETFLFQVKTTDAATFATVAGVLGVVAMLAGAVPARRAMRVEPVVAMRQDGRSN